MVHVFTKSEEFSSQDMKALFKEAEMALEALREEGDISLKGGLVKLS